MTDEVESVLSTVATEVAPTEAERTRLEAVVDEVLAETRATVAELAPEAEVVHVGSTARDTWLSGDRDIDIFVRFPRSTDRETLRERGLAIGRAVLDDGEANYAEHPYIVGSHDGFDVDIVPCLDVPDASQVESAVDRTPFHNEYVRRELDEDLTTAVRLAKQFAVGIEAYGSDLRTRGFGGYLLELLVLEYGDMRALLEGAAGWSPPVTFDPAEHGEEDFEDPLVVIDPTDPTRNVAAVVSETNVARLQHYARRFLAMPDRFFFEAPERSPLDGATLGEHLSARESEIIAVTSHRPDILDDQLFPQLRKSESGLRDALDRAGFDVLRSRVMADDARWAILFECTVPTRAAIERHEGPPVALEDHATRFFDGYADDETVTGPFIEDGRYVIERERAHTTPAALLREIDLEQVGLGEHIRRTLEAEFTVHPTDEVSALLERFGTELRAYFDPEP